MAITYEQFKTGNSKIVERDDLVLGFMIVSDDREFERLYALHIDGNVKYTKWVRRPNNEFCLPKHMWRIVGGPIPDDAEFIGHYKPTMF